MATNQHLTQYIKDCIAEGKTYERVKLEVLKTLIDEMLSNTWGNQTIAAKRLQLNRMTLNKYYHMRIKP